MRKQRIASVISFFILLSSCASGEDRTSLGEGNYLAEHTQTILMGDGDNAEVIKVVPGQDLALLVSSKGRALTLFRIVGDQLQVLREATLFNTDPTESELTHVDIASDGQWAVLTRTMIEIDAQGQQTDCAGELVFVDSTDTESFGAILHQLPVGPMPDSVDISDDDSLVASANERDGSDAWGKCEVSGLSPSVSVVDVSRGPAEATELFRVEMIDADTGPREPESVTFSSDGDLVAVTLQDSHELALFRVSDLNGLQHPTSEDIIIVPLPTNEIGAPPWPDGVASFYDGLGIEHFIIAGEWNDTLIVIDQSGVVVANISVSSSSIPHIFPRVIDEGSPLFSPDSIATFTRGGRSFAAVTLRHSGVVAIYDVTAIEEVAFAAVVAIGQEEMGGADEQGSTVRPEGIAAQTHGDFIVVANEGESSVSLIVGG